MKGYLYNILGNGIEELYWSHDSNLENKIKNSYEDYQENCFDNEKEFEEWFNFNYVAQIERVFLEEIYV